MEQYVSIIGAGAWGTALAQQLATNGYWVCLYTHESEVAVDINQKHRNSRYLADQELSPTIWATTNMMQAAAGEVIFVAYPVPALREMLAPLRGQITPDKILVILSKGIERETGKLPFEVVGETVGVAHMAMLSGPNFAAEVAQGCVGGCVVASNAKRVAERISGYFQNSSLCVSISDDPIGVQLCGALKNVIALNIGIISGQGAAENTKAYFLTQALQEVATIITAYNGRRSTAYGLAGIGDVVLSSWSATGRNYRLGEMLGQGMELSKALAHFASPPEGLYTAQALANIITHHKLNVPVLSGTCDAIREAVNHSKSE